jgi:hypothetical protein
MANFNEAFVPYRVPDKSTELGRNAQTPDERVATLQWCLANDWTALDIGRLERVDTGSFHGWLMWPYINTVT